ncbi:MAG: carboxypeptidase regulatory-like domain-containing protein [Chloroflexi bacterium]|nr:carboxypeptidase regulatory-like domain-containing protein [Chloroflexota bacterium]
MPSNYLSYGAHLANVENLSLLDELGFTWFITYLDWSEIEREDVTPQGGPPYRWEFIQDILSAAVAHGKQVILRVSHAPDWAWRSSQESEDDPPLNIQAFADFMADLARRGRGWVRGYVIWNEPNLPLEWNGRAPQPAWYARMLQAVYPRIKAEDPDAWVIAAGLATVGQEGCGRAPSATPFPGAVDDLAFLRGMYQAGAQGYFDILGTHPYGFGQPPELDPCRANGLAFRRAEQQRAIMEQFGDAGKEMWALEFGWLTTPPQECLAHPSWQDREWQAVDEASQADYLVRAYDYAYRNWPWMGVLFVYNLDFGAEGHYDYCHSERWISLLYRPNPQDEASAIQRRPAFAALKAMPKPGYLPGEISGQVRDSLGNPVAGAVVRLLGVGLRVTGADGVYRFEQVPPGMHTLVAEAPGFIPPEPREGVAVFESWRQRDVDFILVPLLD